jgi:hypothetical protein
MKNSYFFTLGLITFLGLFSISSCSLVKNHECNHLDKLVLHEIPSSDQISIPDLKMVSNLDQQTLNLAGESDTKFDFNQNVCANSWNSFKTPMQEHRQGLRPSRTPTVLKSVKDLSKASPEIKEMRKFPQPESELIVTSNDAPSIWATLGLSLLGILVTLFGLLMFYFFIDPWFLNYWLAALGIGTAIFGFWILWRAYRRWKKHWARSDNRTPIKIVLAIFLTPIVLFALGFRI